MKLFLCLCLITLRSYGDSDWASELRGNKIPIAYVKSKYEQTMHGIEYLFYPAKDPQQLWVLFNGATPGKYTMWSWFWRDDEAWDTIAYLFLKDDDIRWYLGSAERPKTEVYSDIIMAAMASLGLDSSQVCMVGHSMGGYAALYYGLLLSAGSVYVFRPQVTWEAAVTYYSIKKLRDVWVDIDTLVQSVPLVPILYLQYGEFLPDKLSGQALVNAYLERRSVIMTEHTMHTDHIGYHPTKEQLETTIAFMMRYHAMRS